MRWLLANIVALIESLLRLLLLLLLLLALSEKLVPVLDCIVNIFAATAATAACIVTIFAADCCYCLWHCLIPCRPLSDEGDRNPRNSTYAAEPRRGYAPTEVKGPHSHRGPLPE